ncbi:glycosyl hydrolase family 18 protein [uncultured Gilvimarinus sp.]|uniref:glycosyl hydrolase family 18 protein n=1 Tax=uncultured Gilvimarinus sp. TaxID=1689143 RepID=UPI0030ED392C
MKLIHTFSLCSVAALAAHSLQAADCTNLVNWDAQAVYTGGTQVQRSGQAYQANWWTQGNDPSTNSGQYQQWSALGACDGSDPNNNQAPTANVNGPYSGVPGSAIAFDSAGSSDPDGNIASYAWDFGDGASSTQASPSHSYSSDGDYSVTLTVTDNDGASATASTSAAISADSGEPSDCTAALYNAGTQYAAGDLVQNAGQVYRCDIAGWCSSSASWAYEPGNGAHWQEAWSQTDSCSEPGNLAPTANANGPYSGSAGSAITFSSAGSSDPDGTINAYLWEFGDNSTSTEANPSHSYANAGTYQATLTVTDNLGANHSSTANITVVMADQNQPPVAQVNGPFNTEANTSISLSSAGSSDPDGNVVSYDWSFGDGNSSSQANPSHSYSSDGQYTVTLTITDDEGATDSVTTTVTVGTVNTTYGDKVIGYFTNWGVYDRNYHVKNIHTSGSAEKLTHIVYAFGNVKNGQCVVGDAYADYQKTYSAADSVDGVADVWGTSEVDGNFGQLRRLKAMYPQIKVVWSFGGWTWSGGFGQAAANPQQFAQSCHDLVEDPRWADVFDGIDIDWEYPNECGLSCDDSGFGGYRDLMQALRQEFGQDALVTSAIGAGETKINAADYGGAAQYLDFYMLMTYDFFGAWAKQGPTAPHSPLYTYDGIPQQGFTTNNGIEVLKSKGVPAEKIMLGIGFYGRGWTGVTQATPGGTATGAASGTYEAGIEDYKVLKNTCPATGTIAGTAYAKCGNNWWSYDTPATINGKMQYLKQQGLGGAFFWELNGDTDNGELIKAIDNGLQN